MEREQKKEREIERDGMSLRVFFFVLLYRVSVWCDLFLRV